MEPHDRIIAKPSELLVARGGSEERAGDWHEGVDVLIQPGLAALGLAVLRLGMLRLGHPQQEVVRHAAAHRVRGDDHLLSGGGVQLLAADSAPPVVREGHEVLARLVPELHKRVEQRPHQRRRLLDERSLGQGRDCRDSVTVVIWADAYPRVIHPAVHEGEMLRPVGLRAYHVVPNAPIRRLCWLRRQPQLLFDRLKMLQHVAAVLLCCPQALEHQLVLTQHRVLLDESLHLLNLDAVAVLVDDVAHSETLPALLLRTTSGKRGERAGGGLGSQRGEPAPCRAQAAARPSISADGIPSHWGEQQQAVGQAGRAQEENKWAGRGSGRGVAPVVSSAERHEPTIKLMHAIGYLGLKLNCLRLLAMSFLSGIQSGRIDPARSCNSIPRASVVVLENHILNPAIDKLV
eukprot:scaffold1649_cov134-Isochrysis_galbana.AAC.6